MKALTLYQPWASLWLTGAKIHETRSWPTKHRGALAVHAALRAIRPAELSHEVHLICQDYLGMDYVKRLETGAVVGVVELVDCYTSNDLGGTLGPASHQDLICGDFTQNRWLWRRDRVIAYQDPFYCRGRQGLWDWPCTAIEFS